MSFDARFSGEYRPTGAVFQPLPGSIEHCLSAYCLYGRNHLDHRYRLEIHHPPQDAAEAEIRSNSMAAASGITLPGESPLNHFAKRQDVVAWLPRRVHEG